MSKELDRLFPEGKTYIILPDRKIYIFDETYMTPGNDTKPEMVITHRDLNSEIGCLHASNDIYERYRLNGYKCCLTFAANCLVAMDSLDIYSKNCKRVQSFLNEEHNKYI